MRRALTATSVTKTSLPCSVRLSHTRSGYRVMVNPMLAQTIQAANSQRNLGTRNDSCCRNSVMSPTAMTAVAMCSLAVTMMHT